MDKVFRSDCFEQPDKLNSLKVIANCFKNYFPRAVMTKQHFIVGKKYLRQIGTL